MLIMILKPDTVKEELKTQSGRGTDNVSGNDRLFFFFFLMLKWNFRSVRIFLKMPNVFVPTVAF